MNFDGSLLGITSTMMANKSRTEEDETFARVIGVFLTIIVVELNLNFVNLIPVLRCFDLEGIEVQ